MAPVSQPVICRHLRGDQLVYAHKPKCKVITKFSIDQNIIGKYQLFILDFLKLRHYIASESSSGAKAFPYSLTP